MTFDEIKARLKLRRAKLIISFFAITVFGFFIPLRVRRRYSVLSTLGGVTCTLLALAGIIAIVLYDVKLILYIKEHTYCLKCKKPFGLNEIFSMDTFHCPYCGNEKFDDDTVEIWFK